ncbi:MAG: tetratricopeptide repeat protein [Dermatophilaceae bacterium]|nr:tetratricopeptide repeat protein [Dermatophilaceae bacterium]MBP9918948.1 tetratricopeptide repeat protein [Dermatophilaceae bacterium]
MSQPGLTAAALRGAVDLSALKRAGAPTPVPRQGSGDGAGAGNYVVTCTDATFQDVAAASMRWPVVVVLWSGRLQESAAYVRVLGELATSYSGRIQIASVDVDSNPGLLRAFQIQSVPSVLGLVQGQPVPLYVGALPPAEVTPWIDELLKVAVQYGVTGRAPDGAAPADPAVEAPAEEKLSPLLEAAYSAIDAGDYDAAVTAYEQALRENPGDSEAALGLAQVELLRRTHGIDLAAARAAAAADPLDVAAALLVADLDVLGGHVEDAFSRLVDLVRVTGGDERTTARTHLLGLFDVVGASDARVVAARKALTSALF